MASSSSNPMPVLNTKTQLQDLRRILITRFNETQEDRLHKTKIFASASEHQQHIVLLTVIRLAVRMTAD
jgi:hypothetical protein